MTSFYLNKGFSLCMSFSPDTTKTATVQEKLQIHSAIEITKIMNRILSVTHDNLMRTQGDMIRQANHWHHIKNFAVENEVIVNTQNLVSDQSTRALNNKRCEPFRILQQFHFFYKLNIPSEWYAIDTFHASNLTRAADPKQSPLTEQRNPPPEPAVINDKNQAEWALEKILNSQYSGPSHHLQYKIHWSDCDPDPIWYNADDNKFQNIFKALQEYHAQYSNKPGLQFIGLKLIHHQSTRTDWKEIQNAVSEVVSGSLLLPY